MRECEEEGVALTRRTIAMRDVTSEMMDDGCVQGASPPFSPGPDVLSF